MAPCLQVYSPKGSSSLLNASRWHCLMSPETHCCLGGPGRQHIWPQAQSRVYLMQRVCKYSSAIIWKHQPSFRIIYDLSFSKTNHPSEWNTSDLLSSGGVQWAPLLLVSIKQVPGVMVGWLLSLSLPPYWTVRVEMLCCSACSLSSSSEAQFFRLRAVAYSYSVSYIEA